MPKYFRLLWQRNKQIMFVIRITLLISATAGDVVEQYQYAAVVAADDGHISQHPHTHTWHDHRQRQVHTRKRTHANILNFISFGSIPTPNTNIHTHNTAATAECFCISGVFVNVFVCVCDYACHRFRFDVESKRITMRMRHVRGECAHTHSHTYKPLLYLHIIHTKMYTNMSWACKGVCVCVFYLLGIWNRKHTHASRDRNVVHSWATLHRSHNESALYTYILIFAYAYFVGNSDVYVKIPVTDIFSNHP